MLNLFTFSSNTAAFVAISLTATLLSPTLARTEQLNQVNSLAEATSSSNQLGVPFTSQERTQIANKLLANPQLAPRMKNHRIRVLSVVSTTGEKATNGQRPGKRLASVLLFNYSTNKATRFLVDPTNGAVLSQEELRGRIRASEEELQEAMRIIQANREHASLLQAGGILEGGFIVDGPKGAPDNRYIQMQLLTADRRSIQRVVVIDLTKGTIASSSRQ